MRELNGQYSLYPGCDPEVFVTRRVGASSKDVILGSERVVPADALPKGADAVPGDHYCYVTRDGVQVELHARSSGCRQELASQIQSAFRLLINNINTTKWKGSAQVRPTLPLVTLRKLDLARLSPESRLLNCRESKNASGRDPIKRDGNEYLIRTASGHLHLGSEVPKRADPDDLVKLLDLMVGIPCVMMDQHPSQRVRRETYGRAGEYRLPKHGIEYRVPSNFWLRDYKLMSGVFGMARLALRVGEALIPNTRGTKWAYEMVTKNVDWAEVERVINENDFEGAVRIFQQNLRAFSENIPPYHSFGLGLTTPFEYFCERVWKRRESKEHNDPSGLSAFFNAEDKAVVNHWLHLDRSRGWESFLQYTVEPQWRQMKLTGIILDPVKDVARAEQQPVAPVAPVAPRRNRDEGLRAAA